MHVLIKNPICPHVQDPFEDCYCFNLTSRYVKSAIHYCGNHFTSCDIYKRNLPGEKKNPAGMQANAVNAN